MGKCVFGEAFVLHEIDPRIKAIYERLGKKAPFGDFRRSWNAYHCVRLGGRDDCPYNATDCALAFYQAAERAATAQRPGAMFRVLARSAATHRLEHKPLARENPRYTAAAWSVPHSVGIPPRAGAGPRRLGSVQGAAPWDTVDVGESGPLVRRRLSRPQRIGEVFRSLDARPREVPPDDGQEGSR